MEYFRVMYTIAVFDRKLLYMNNYTGVGFLR